MNLTQEMEFWEVIIVKRLGKQKLGAKCVTTGLPPPTV